MYRYSYTAHSTCPSHDITSPLISGNLNMVLRKTILNSEARMMKWTSITPQTYTETTYKLPISGAAGYTRSLAIVSAERIVGFSSQQSGTH